MAVLSELFVKIGADASKLKSGLTDAEGRMGKFSQSIMKHHRAIGVAMTALGGAIVAVGVMSVKTYARMGDEVHKMALRTGFSTEALSELRYAAELSGTSLQGLEKASRTLSGAIVDAGEGLSTYVRAFDRIGLSYEDLEKLSPEQQFITVMEALAGVEDETVRAATAADLLGARVGTALLPMLADGKVGLDEMRQGAHDLNMVFSTESAEGAAALTDSFTTLEGAVNGIKKAIAENLMPILMPLIEKITETTTKVGDWMKAHPELAKVIVIVTGAIGLLLLVLGPLLIFLPGIIAFLPILGGAFAVLTGPIGLVILAVGLLIAAGIALWKNWDKVVHFFKRAWINIKIYFLTGIDKILSALRKFTDFLPWLGEKIEIAHNAIRDMIDAEEVKKDALILQRELTISTEAMDTATESAKEMEVALAAVGETSNETSKILEGQTEAIDALAKSYEGLGIAPAVGITPAGAAGAWGVGEGAPPGMTLPQYEAAARAVRAVSPGMTATESFRQARLANLQEGGIVTRPTLAMMGERGAEAIIPLDKAGMGMNLTINFAEPVFMEREESINRLAERIYTKIKQSQRFSFGRAYGG